MSWPIRLAEERDIPALEKLIELSVRTLLAEHYAPAVLDASLGSAFGVDRRLIRDRSYFVVEHEGRLIACGGWSRRGRAYGADHGTADEPPLDPATDHARIRAFFVHPEWTRRGLGQAILNASEAAARAAGFTRALLIGTLAGEKLYTANGYVAEEKFEAPLPNGQLLTVIRMTKALASPTGFTP